MRVLVTGGAGFIGSNYVRHALSGDYAGFEPEELVVLDKSPTRATAPTSPRSPTTRACGSWSATSAIPRS